MDFKLLNINCRPLVRFLRCNSSLVDVKHVPFTIPGPIQRSSTDLLKALAGTVKEDETSSHFGLVDDPIMLPTSSKSQRTYLMSKELGRRTARKLVEEWPTLFMFDRDTPELMAFRPQKPLDPELVEPNEENLQKIVMDRRVSDAIKLYQKIIEANIHISEATKLDLFRLVCYYNERNFPLTEFEEWHTIRYFYSNRENKESEWKEGGIAENLFSELPKTDESFSTLICAFCKFPGEYSLGKARKLYSEMTSAGLIPFEEVFNSLISVQVPLSDRGTFDAANWMREMCRLGVRPSVKTFNAVLSSLLFSIEKCERKASGEGTEEIVAVLFADVGLLNEPLIWKNASYFMYEMRLHGLDPNLTTYSHLLKLVPSKFVFVSLLDEMLTRLEDKLANSEQIERAEDNDADFFRTAMSIARILGNESQIDRLISIYKSKHNKVFFECFDDQQRFYSNFAYNKLQVLPLDSFYFIYKLYVPRLLGISAPFISEILKTMKERKPAEFCWPLLKRVAEDLISSNILSNGRLAYNILIHLTDVKPKLFNLPDWQSYMELCRKVVDTIEQLDKIKFEREMSKNDQ